MIRLGEGRIVNLTSYVAVRPTPYQTGYAAGKAGIVSLTEALAASLEGSGVKAFSVAPGFTPTEMTRNLVESEAGKRWLPDVGKGRSVDAESSARSSRGSRAAPAMSSTGASSTRSTIPRSCCGGSTRFGGTSSTPRDCVACRPRRSSEPSTPRRQRPSAPLVVGPAAIALADRSLRGLRPLDPECGIVPAHAAGRLGPYGSEIM